MHCVDKNSNTGASLIVDKLDMYDFIHTKSHIL